MDVALLMFADKYGGAGALAVNLHDLLESKLGLDVVIFKIGKRTSPRKYLMRGDSDTTYTVMSCDDMVKLDCPALITHIALTGKKWGNDNIVVAMRVINSGKLVLCLDRRSVHKSVVELCNVLSVPLLCNSEALALYILEIGANDTLEIPQPYNAVDFSGTKIVHNAVSMTRVDYHKNVELMLQANYILPMTKRIHIYGKVGGGYAYRFLDVQYPDWRNSYRGTPEDIESSAILVNGSANYSVDMSTLSDDGGRTQYSFLEAMNAGSILVINRDWLSFPGCMEDGVNCVTASDADELADILLRDSSEFKLNYEDVLHKAGSHHTARMWYDVICKRYD